MKICYFILKLFCFLTTTLQNQIGELFIYYFFTYYSLFTRNFTVNNLPLQSSNIQSKETIDK